MNRRQKTNKKIRCDRCNSINVIKRGKRKTKIGISQRYECKECGRRFTHELIKHRKAKIIAFAMDLHFKGLSTRKIGDKIKVHHTTIIRWIRKINEKKRLEFSYRKGIERTRMEIAESQHILNDLCR